MKKWIFQAIPGIGLVLLWLAWFALKKNSPDFTSPIVGHPIPAVLILDHNGEIKPLAQLLDGRRSILYFWAPTCWTCRQEIPELHKVSFKIDPQVPILSIALMMRPDEMKDVLEDSQSYPFPLFFDPDGLVGLAFGVTRTPEWFLIENFIVSKHLRRSLLDSITWTIFQELNLWRDKIYASK